MLWVAAQWIELEGCTAQQVLAGGSHLLNHKVAATQFCSLARPQTCSADRTNSDAGLKQLMTWDAT
jgi:hypothetical protein